MRNQKRTRCPDVSGGGHRNLSSRPPLRRRSPGAGDAQRLSGAARRRRPEGARRIHADLQRQGSDRLARQQDEPSRHDAGLPRPPRADRRHPESARQGRHPADRQEIQELRGLHRGQAGLGLRQRPVPPLERGRRGVSGHARLPAGRRHGRHLRRTAEGRDQRQCAGAGRGPDARAARRAGPRARARSGRRPGSAKPGTRSAPASKETCRRSRSGSTTSS